LSDDKFRPVMLAVLDFRSQDNVKEYLNQIGRCQRWDERGRKDRAEMIRTYELYECDALEY
jgi:hypothetical protein